MGEAILSTNNDGQQAVLIPVQDHPIFILFTVEENSFWQTPHYFATQLRQLQQAAPNTLDLAVFLEHFEKIDEASQKFCTKEDIPLTVERLLRCITENDNAIASAILLNWLATDETQIIKTYFLKLVAEFFADNAAMLRIIKMQQQLILTTDASVAPKLLLLIASSYLNESQQLPPTINTQIGQSDMQQYLVDQLFARLSSPEAGSAASAVATPSLSLDFIYQLRPQYCAQLIEKLLTAGIALPAAMGVLIASSDDLLNAVYKRLATDSKNLLALLTSTDVSDEVFTKLTLRFAAEMGEKRSPLPQGFGALMQQRSQIAVLVADAFIVQHANPEHGSFEVLIYWNAIVDQFDEAAFNAFCIRVITHGQDLFPYLYKHRVINNERIIKFLDSFIVQLYPPLGEEHNKLLRQNTANNIKNILSSPNPAWQNSYWLIASMPSLLSFPTVLAVLPQFTGDDMGKIYASICQSPPPFDEYSIFTHMLRTVRASVYLAVTFGESPLINQPLAQSLLLASASVSIADLPLYKTNINSLVTTDLWQDFVLNVVTPITTMISEHSQLPEDRSKKELFEKLAYDIKQTVITTLVPLITAATVNHKECETAVKNLVRTQITPALQSAALNSSGGIMGFDSVLRTIMPSRPVSVLTTAIANFCDKASDLTPGKHMAIGAFPFRK